MLNEKYQMLLDNMIFLFLIPGGDGVVFYVLAKMMFMPFLRLLCLKSGFVP